MEEDKNQKESQELKKKKYATGYLILSTLITGLISGGITVPAIYTNFYIRQLQAHGQTIYPWWEGLKIYPEPWLLNGFYIFSIWCAVSAILYLVARFIFRSNIWIIGAIIVTQILFCIEYTRVMYLSFYLYW